MKPIDPDQVKAQIQFFQKAAIDGPTTEVIAVSKSNDAIDAILDYFDKLRVDLEKPPTRRPPWGFNIPFEGDGKLAIKPWFRMKQGTPEYHLDAFEFEVIKDAGTLSGMPLLMTKAKGTIYRGGSMKMRLQGKRKESRYTADDWDEMREGVEAGIHAQLAAFTDDPEGMFARVSDNCCMCGRGLSDGESRARGVGPECLKMGNVLFDLVQRIKARRLEAA